MLQVVIGPATVGGIQAGAFKIGDTAGTIDNIIHCKLYRPGSVGFVSKSVCSLFSAFYLFVACISLTYCTLYYTAPLINQLHDALNKSHVVCCLQTFVSDVRLRFYICLEPKNIKGTS